MKRALIWTIGGVAAVAIVGGGVFWWQREEAERSAWLAAVPREPAFGANTTSELRERIQKADAAVKQRAGDVRALGELARLYLANGYQREAETALRGLTKYDPTNARWDHYLATLLAGYGRLEEAIAFWQKTVRLDPHYRTAQLKLAEALLKTNRLDESRKLYSGVLAQDPSEPYASLGLAQIEIQDGRWAAAREHLETAVGADPLFSAGWALLATVDDRLGDSGGSDQAREKANVLGRFKDVPDPWMDELVPDIYDAYRLQVIASTISATGGAEKAIPILQRAIQVAPKDSRPHRQLGKLEVTLHQNDQARAEFEKAIALQPHDPFAYIDLVGLYRNSGDVNAALRLLGDAVKNCPTAEGVQLEMGLALMAANRVGEALPYLQKAVELAPDNPTNYEELAKAQFRLDEKAAGAETLKTGLARAPENGGLLATRARYEIEIGDEAAAASDFARARKADPNEPMLPQVAAAFEKRFGRRVE